MDQAYQIALNTLRACCTPIGFKASGKIDGYSEIWARDSLMAALAAQVSGDTDLLNTAKASIKTLQHFQTSLGMLPNNVDATAKQADYQATIDGTLWFVIVVHALHLEEYYPAAEQALQWLSNQDVDQSGVLSIQEAGDWQDLFPTHGKVLYDNVLYYYALKIAGDQTQANLVQESMQKYFWTYELSSVDTSKLVNPVSLEYAQIFQQENAQLVHKYPYLLAWRGFHEAGTWFDTLGNMLAVLFDLTDTKQTQAIFNYAEQHDIFLPYPAKAIYPTIQPGETYWREYFRKRDLNLPNHYHNGGSWPFIGGWSVLTLLKDKQKNKAETLLNKLAEIIIQTDCNEWLDGMTGQPLGRAQQVWSAALYILAYRAVRDKVTLF
ncbi:MAG: glycoside hydrolase 100 family protein [Patescibacteria group bacterium]|jgi:glycogen debranching enzyme